MCGKWTGRIVVRSEKVLGAGKSHRGTNQMHVCSERRTKRGAASVIHLPSLILLKLSFSLLALIVVCLLRAFFVFLASFRSSIPPL